jgi:hypothetical protein
MYFWYKDCLTISHAVSKVVEFVSQVVFFCCKFCLLLHLLVHFRFSITVLVYDYQVVVYYYFVSLFGFLKRYKSPALLYVFPALFLLLLPSNISRLHNFLLFFALTILCFIIIVNVSMKIYYPCCVNHHILYIVSICWFYFVLWILVDVFLI